MSETQKQNNQELFLATGTGSLKVAEQNGYVTIDLEELFYRVLAAWKWLIALMIVGGILAGLFTSFFITPTYKATSTIYVLSNKDSVINMSDLQLGSALTNDYIKIFNIWEVHEQVISNLNLPYSYKTIQKMVSPTNTANTRMIDITVTSTNPKEAADIANEYASVVSQYIADTMAVEKPTIMSEALVPVTPDSPKKSRNIILGILLGFIMVVAFVTIKYITDDKIKTADDVFKYTGIYNLAAIPNENNKAGKGKK